MTEYLSDLSPGFDPADHMPDDGPCIVCGAYDGDHDAGCTVAQLDDAAAEDIAADNDGPLPDGSCHPDCGPITISEPDGTHAHENEDGRCWHGGDIDSINELIDKLADADEGEDR